MGPWACAPAGNASHASAANPARREHKRPIDSTAGTCWSVRTTGGRAPRIGWLVAVLIATVAVAASPTAARADGDPASDVLATQPLFVPQDAGIPLAQQGQLTALVRERGARRLPGSRRADRHAERSRLGHRAVARAADVRRSSWGKSCPSSTAVRSWWSCRTASASGAPARLARSERSVLRGVPIRSGQGGLARPLSAPCSISRRRPVTMSRSRAPAASVAPPRSSDPGAIVALAIGAALIILAWTVSLRARPPRALRRP